MACSSSALAALGEAIGILGLVFGGELALAIVYNPLAAAFLLAKIGVGAFLNGRPINVSGENGCVGYLRDFRARAVAFRLLRRQASTASAT
jgi:fructose-1,6-bisphosphatase/inositol monophosphatase family enzyme